MSHKASESSHHDILASAPQLGTRFTNKSPSELKIEDGLPTVIEYKSILPSAPYPLGPRLYHPDAPRRQDEKLVIGSKLLPQHIESESAIQKSIDAIMAGLPTGTYNDAGRRINKSNDPVYFVLDVSGLGDELKMYDSKLTNIRDMVQTIGQKLRKNHHSYKLIVASKDRNIQYALSNGGFLLSDTVEDALKMAQQQGRVAG